MKVLCSAICPHPCHPGNPWSKLCPADLWYALSEEKRRDSRGSTTRFCRCFRWEESELSIFRHPPSRALPLPTPRDVLYQSRASRSSQRHFHLLHTPRRISQRFAHVVFREVWIEPHNFNRRVPGSDEPHHGADRHTHPANTWFAAHDVRVVCDVQRRIHVLHCKIKDRDCTR